MTDTKERWQSDLFRRLDAEAEARGRVEGEAQAVLAVLKSRRIHVPDQIAERIVTCTDTSQIEAWLERAATARSIDDILTA